MVDLTLSRRSALRLAGSAGLLTMARAAGAQPAPAIAKGTTLDEALQTVKLPQYKDWRNYNRLDGEIRSLYELIRTGKRSYFD